MCNGCLGIRVSKAMRRRLMRKGGAANLMAIPAKQELAVQYCMPPNGRGLTISQVAKAYGVSVTTVREWFAKYALIEPFSYRHSKRMAGQGNPAWKNGDSYNYEHTLLSQERVCKWCGATENLQRHHLDGDKRNNAPDNFAWLCRPCNMLEAYLRAAAKGGRVEVVHAEGAREITIRFLEKEV